MDAESLPTQRVFRDELRQELGCLLCGRPIEDPRTGKPAWIVVTAGHTLSANELWLLRQRCDVCGGQAQPGEVVSVRIYTDSYDWHVERPPRGRPSKAYQAWLAEREDQIRESTPV